ncbi:MAG: hypothetical protein BRC41_00990 [Cyanobacteria bacterium QH_9_48_43]|nr:MAG: hypothetical protein BRC41_00990 [Cyanobacteria bacterium QH_9_48_43]PSO98517.1 MAG: hypothetical protein BRC51_14870 [Cyanobacteria bacterium SW_12_48_29]PSO99167.1 MAG: hypothetical protein BRC53_03880 [Cyanobacteria bacterium SW_6_48_11]PSP25304.1 MAG: hypothetical protein BRC52_00735 [Cyanobacteria bacterium SW_5_48_44]
MFRSTSIPQGWLTSEIKSLHLLRAESVQDQVSSSGWSQLSEILRFEFQAITATRKRTIISDIPPVKLGNPLNKSVFVSGRISMR